jgi:Spy/CpxP family protein refolding chaperone
MKRLSGGLLVLGLVCGSALVVQARPGGGHRGQQGMMQGLKEEAGLSDEQAAKVKELFGANKDARKKAHAEMKAATATLEALAAGHSTDEKAYQAQLDNLGNANQALQGIRQQEITGMRGILKPSQQARVVLRLRHKVVEHLQPGGGSDVVDGE